MPLIETKDIYQATGLKKLGSLGYFIAILLKNVLSINRLNKLYDKGCHLEKYEFLDYLTQEIGVTYDLHEADFMRIPKEGPFIIIANHPLGAMDGILMMKIISKVRPDFKVMGNFLLQKIEPLSSMVIPVNPFETRKEAFNSNAGLKETIQHLKEGKCLGIFPAGEVSTIKGEHSIYLDREWQISAIKLIQKMRVPIVPMYFHAKNSNLFYRLAALSADLQTALLPREMMRAREKPIPIRIGKVIYVKQQEEFTDINNFARFIRKKTYSLSSFYYIGKHPLMQYLKISQDLIINSRKRTPKPIISETPQDQILLEIEKLRHNNEDLLFSDKRYECYLAKADDIPNILREIGRLREITFRQVGEGTNLEIDIDRFDLHYRHMFLWDTTSEQIAGAYRMGIGEEIYKKYGVDGFYLNQLFNMEEKLHPFLKECIEMGRAFVVPEYQQKPMPLFLLWQGIVHLTIRYPQLHYIIGGVSISNQFSNFSKSLIIEFMKSNFYDNELAKLIHPKKEFKVRMEKEDRDFFFEEAQADLNKFDKIIDELEPNFLRLPVLIKKYIKQNAKIIGFNVDPAFNNAIDGLMYIRVKDLPDETTKAVREEYEKAKIAQQSNKIQ